MPYPAFDRSRLVIKPLNERQHDLQLGCMLALEAASQFAHPAVATVAECMRTACGKRTAGGVPASVLMMGAHVIRAGVSRLVIDLMERGLVTHVAMNGAGPIHDWEFALIGATTESVARYIRTGEFGLWRETGAMNEVIRDAARDGVGLGEALGRAILEGPFPHRDVSILAAGARLGVPVTVHVGIGYDIIHEHPNCDGAALGAASMRDFLVFTQTITGLEGGVLLCFGSAVMGPEVYLKALAMARNVAHQEGRQIRQFCTAVFDLVPLPDDTRHETTKANPQYYFRPWKTILARTVADGGESYYIQGDHRETFPALYRACVGR
jgi:hypothetical protein